MGGCQRTSLIGGALEEWILTVKALMIEKSGIEVFVVLEVLFPQSETLAINMETADFQGMILSLNLAWFLAYKITLKRLIKAAIMISWHRGFQDQWHKFQMSSIVVNWMLILRIVANHDHKLKANEQVKNMWKDVSEGQLHRL